MAAQLSVLQSRVQAWGYGADTAAQQTIFLNIEYRKLNSMYPWKWLEKQATFTSSAQSIALTSFGTDVRNIDALRAQLSSSQPTTQYHLDWMDEQTLRELISRDAGDPSAKAPPKYWTLWAGNILLWPNPDQSYFYTMDYLLRVQPLVITTDLTVCPDEFDDLLVYKAVAGMAVRQRDWLTRDFVNQEYEQTLRRLLTEETRNSRQTTERVQSSGMYTHGIRMPRVWTR